MRPPVRFICDATPAVGFGHLSRCLYVAAGLGPKRSIRFEGEFSAEAKRRIAAHGYSVERGDAPRPGGLAVVDLMFDAQDMDYYDRRRLLGIRRRFDRVVLISSARSAPASLPVDAVVGHVLPAATARSRAFRTLAGLRYAPVPPAFGRERARRRRLRREIARVFVGFGASRDVHGLTCVLDALSREGFAGRVDVLLSPFHERHRPALENRADPYRLRLHANVPSVAPLLGAADVAFGTYGNVTFEALSLGTPFVVVAAKSFQERYARSLERRGLLVCLGRAETLEEAAVVRAWRGLTPERRARLRRRARQAVDARGIERLRRVVREEAALAA